MQEVYLKIGRAAVSDETVLVLGESGTGKELVAQLIHQNSGRAHNPFVVVDCGAMPSSLIESALFGHVKGAYTDAHSPRKGKFQQADSGTIFLDEIGELPIEVQMKLLRVLQEREVEPMGRAPRHTPSMSASLPLPTADSKPQLPRKHSEKTSTTVSTSSRFRSPTATGTQRGYTRTHRSIYTPVCRRIPIA